MLDWLKHILETNAVFSGGFALSLFGGTLAAFYRVPSVLWPILKRKFITQIEFGNEDQAYQWILSWLSHQPYLQHTKHIRVLSSLDNPEDSLISQTRKPLFSIPEGLHWFTYKDRFIWVTLAKTKMPVSSSRGAAPFFGEITLSTVFAPNSFILDVVSEAKALYDKRDNSSISIYIPESWEDGWKKLTSKSMRPLSSLVYDENLGQKVLEDLQSFFISKEWYTQMGIPWRRGYLLHGVPGGGKTTLVMALAGELTREIYILNLSKPELSDDGLIRLLNSVPSGSFLLIEEIDCLFDGRLAKKNDKQTLTFSGLLAALDGVTSTEGRILFMTTNHFDKLDPALSRPGRADMHLQFRNASRKQVAKLVGNFFPDRSTDEINASLSSINLDGELPMAAVQEALVSNREDFRAAILALDTH